MFEDYDPNSILVKLNPWRADMPSLLEEDLKPEHFKVKKDAMI